MRARFSGAPSADLVRVQALFDAWRARRQKRERIPAQLWDAAVALLDAIPLAALARQLRVAPDRLGRHRDALVAEPARDSARGPAAPPAFLELPLGALAANGQHRPASCEEACRIVLERADRARLSLAVPLSGWDRVDALCRAFLATR